MKQLFTLMALISFCSAASAQKESDSIRVGNMIILTKKDKKDNDKREDVRVKPVIDTPVAKKPVDSLRVGNIIIIRDGNKSQDNENGTNKKTYWNRHRNKQGNVSTNWIILDLGFSNYVNKTTDYTNGGGYVYNRAGATPLGENDFDLNVGKSINVNIWLFMQRLNLVSHHLNLKYGLGVELNSYRYKSSVSYLRDNPFVTGVAPAPVVIRDSVSFTKNKLATDYVTVPLMLSYSTNPNNQNKGFGVSFGVSAGYLYSQRNKQVSSERGKEKTSSGIGVKQFKISYVGEIGLGPVRLYGSYSPSSFYKKQLDMRPYTLGIRFSNW
jgi:hypothetical protein